MNAQGTKGLITGLGSIAGAVGFGALGLPPGVGAKIGYGATSLATSGIKDTPKRRKMFAHSDVGPGASYTNAHNARPQANYEQVYPEATKLDNMLSLFGPLAGGFAGTGMESIMKNRAALPTDGVPSARTGMFIPPTAPTHEQGGVPLVNKQTGEVMAEAEGNEYVVPGERVENIMDAKSYAEIGKRFVGEVGRLQQKGMNEFQGRNGMLLNPGPMHSATQGLRNQNMQNFGLLGNMQLGSLSEDLFDNIYEFDGNKNYGAQQQDFMAPFKDGQRPQAQDHGIPFTDVSYSPAMQSGLEEAAEEGDIAPSAQDFNFYGDQEMGQAFDRIMGRGSSPFRLGSPEKTNTPPVTPPGSDLSNHYDQAINAQERANRLGNNLRFVQGAINMRGLMEPWQSSQPLKMPNFQRVNFEDPSDARINQADRELGIGIDAMSNYSAPERIAAMPGLLNNYGQQMAQISEAKSGLMNQQEQVNAQIDMQEKQTQLGVDAQNKANATAEGQLKHARDQVGLAGLSDAISGAIESSTQSQTNVAELSIIKDMMTKMNSDQQAQFALRMGPLLRMHGINYNPNTES